MATSPIPFRGPEIGHNGYIILAFLGIPTAEHTEKLTNGYFTPAYSGAQVRAEWLHNPYLLGGPHCSEWRENQERRKTKQDACITLPLFGVPGVEHGGEMR